jgi:hypothetical protein
MIGYYGNGNELRRKKKQRKDLSLMCGKKVYEWMCDECLGRMKETEGEKRRDWFLCPTCEKAGRNYWLEKIKKDQEILFGVMCGTCYYRAAAKGEPLCKECEERLKAHEERKQDNLH